MMSNGAPPPAPHDAIAIDAQPQWLFPLECAPPPPRNEGCILHGLSDPAPLQSNGSSPYSPPIIMMSPVPSSPTPSTCAATSPMQTVPPPDRHTASMEAFRDESRRLRDDFQEAFRDESRRFKEELDERRRRYQEESQAFRREASAILRRIQEDDRRNRRDLAVALIRIKEVHDASANEKIPPSPSSTETKSSSPTPPRPTSSSLGKYNPINGADPLTSTPALQASSSTRASTAITPSPMARRRDRPRRRPSRRHRPQAFEAIPSHPVPTMGGTTMPTMTHLLSARATVICRSTSPKTVTVSPSTQPFIIHRSGDVGSPRGRNALFRDCGERPRKRPRRRPHARRVCRRHGPRAPSLGSLCGRRHRPRAPNISPEAS